MLESAVLHQLPDMIRKAGEIVRSAHDVRTCPDDVEAKPGSANFVTVYDKKVQDFLLEQFHTLLPEAKFLAEEKENRPEDLQDGLCFIIDPIDGTTNFIHRYECSTISVALLENGEPVYAAILNPYTGDLFTAQAGKGAFRNGEPIHVTDAPLAQGLVLFGTSPYYKETRADATFELAKAVFLACSDLRRSGSAAWDLCSVACGKAEGFFEAFLSPWDYAAGWLIVKEAGGVLTQFDGSPVSFAEGCPVVASNLAAAEELRKLTGQY